MEQEKASMQALMDDATNHPSVILIGFFNEGDSSNERGTVPSHGRCRS